MQIPERIISEELAIIYDKDCFFCQSYVQLLTLSKRVGNVQFINAREKHPLVVELAQKNYDLNKGMAVVFAGKIYYAHDALVFISLLTIETNITGRLLAYLLRNKTRAKFLYPILKMGRKLLLLIQNKKPYLL
jgi:predicted DCC family thiol-disulfide oxidoreductase YuxK